MTETTTTQPYPAPPTEPEPRKVSLLLAVGITFFPYIFGWFTLRKGHSIKARAVSLIWAITLYFGVFNGDTKPPVDPGVAAYQAAAPVSNDPLSRNKAALRMARRNRIAIQSQLHQPYSPGGLEARYKKNAMRAERDLKGNVISVRGKLERVDTTFGSPFAVVGEGGRFSISDVHCSLSKEAVDEAIDLDTGTEVVIVGTVGTYIMSPVLDDCTIKALSHLKAKEQDITANIARLEQEQAQLTKAEK